MSMCDVCGDDLSYKGTDIVAINIVVDIANKKIDHPEIFKVKNAFGKLEFNICFLCWLKNLGIKVQ